MKLKTKNIITVIALIFVAPLLFSQSGYLDGISIEESDIKRKDSLLSLKLNIALTDFKVGSNEMVILTPILVSNSDDIQTELQPIVITGNKRFKILQRNILLNNPTGFNFIPYEIVKWKNNTSQNVLYNVEIPLMMWMKDASLELRKSIKECADCNKGEDLIVLEHRVIPKDYVPSYKLTYIVPEVEVKTLSDRHTAMINFVVDRWELLRDYKDNAKELSQVDRVVSEIRNNPDFEITEFTI